MKLRHYIGIGLLLGLIAGVLIHLLRRRPCRRYASVHPSAPTGGFLTPPRDREDAARADFLARLDGAPLALTDWEAGFIESNIGRTCYTAKQRVVIDRLRAKYERRHGYTGPVPPRLPGRFAPPSFA